jgi:catechol-2,3-dioxygenase
MSRIGLRIASLARAGDFYSRLFGTEITSAASSRSRAFSLGDSVLELISAPASSGSTAGRGLVYIRIAVNDFSVEAATRILRERGIESSATQGAVHISDPDGMRIELAAGS